jgi:hypothetical protein
MVDPIELHSHSFITEVGEVLSPFSGFGILFQYLLIPDELLDVMDDVEAIHLTGCRLLDAPEFRFVGECY